MASKYAGLKGKIPGEPTVHEKALLEELATLDKKQAAELTALFNTATAAGAELAAQVAKNALRLKALKLTILKRIDESGGDGFKGMNGFTWTESFEPYPSCDNPAAVIEYFKEHGMEDQLLLKASEINSRVENFVKEEGLRGELRIETEKVSDPETGEEREVQVVRSKIPGVKVYLDTKLSRVKVGTKSVKEKE